jgi:hypothetical protein
MVRSTPRGMAWMRGLGGVSGGTFMEKNPSRLGLEERGWEGGSGRREGVEVKRVCVCV